MIKVRKSRSRRICQGDVFRDVEYLESALENEGVIQVVKVVFPLVIVLTQDCDLEQDYRFRWSREARNVRTQDKWLLSVLVAPLYNAEHVYLGEHLSELGIRMEPINRKKTPGDYLRNNERPRYHYLDFPASVQIVPSVIDFKHYFSVNVNYLRNVKKSQYVCSLADLFREEVSQRFANYLARIGLPADNPHLESERDGAVKDKA